MTDKGFEDYLFGVYGRKTGAASSYITAIEIIDEMFAKDDKFALKGESVLDIIDLDLLDMITRFVYEQQLLFKKGEDSIFRNINPQQTSYPRNNFCSAAISRLFNYRSGMKFKEADDVIKGKRSGIKISKDLLNHFDINKEGIDVIKTAKTRLGQDYFRKMIIANYQGKCCVTGLNVPQTLRASHIVAWADDVINRLNPENGLCLSATYDAAFDKHLISFDKDYRMILSKQIKEYFTADVTKDYFENFEGRRITLPSQFLPNKKFLEKHRNLMIV